MDLYAFILVTLLAYNNALVLLGPTAWGSGMGPRRVYVVAIIGQILGALTSPMPQIKLGPGEFVYLMALYLLMTALKISLPLSVASFAISTPRLDAMALWFGSPLAAIPVCLFRKMGRRGVLTTLFLTMYLFGSNNIAIFSRDPIITTVAAAMGTYLGLGFSRWVLELVAFRGSDVAAINTAVIFAATVGIVAGIPISFTLVAYSAIFALSFCYKVKIIRFENMLKGYLGLVVALLTAFIYHALKSRLLLPALPIS